MCVCVCVCVIKISGNLKNQTLTTGSMAIFRTLLTEELHQN